MKVEPVANEQNLMEIGDMIDLKIAHARVMAVVSVSRFPSEIRSGRNTKRTLPLSSLESTSIFSPTRSLCRYFHLKRDIWDAQDTAKSMKYW